MSPFKFSLSWFFKIPENSLPGCDRAHPSVKLIKDETVARRRRVLTERFGQMDGQTGCALSAQPDVMRRDGRTQGREDGVKWRERR